MYFILLIPSRISRSSLIVMQDLSNRETGSRSPPRMCNSYANVCMYVRVCVCVLGRVDDKLK